MKVYRMGECGVAVTVEIKIAGSNRIVTGWHQYSIEEATNRLIKQLEKIKTDAQALIDQVKKG